MSYLKAAKYTDLETIYSQVSGPGGLALAEFIAEIPELRSGRRLLDVGINRGYQSCFIAKEYGVTVIGIEPWADFFVTVDETEAAVRTAGFEIGEAGYAPDARKWWLEFAEFDPYCRQDPEGEAKVIRADNGRWLSFGYVIARKAASAN